MLHTELQEEEVFQEADILWPDAAKVYFQVDDNDDDEDDYSSQHRGRASMKLQTWEKASSPIDIPGWKVRATGEKGTRATAGFSKLGGASRAGSGSSGGCSVVIGSHVFVPPHVIVDRRAKREKAMMMFVVPSGKAKARKMRE
ncbi:hypothetical protein ACP70R_036853 [Stipagrostis hirtigluma subsp. patula]